jgi:phosphoglucomutase
MYDCYTGFKWIASVIRDLEGKERYIGGGEESYGFLAQDFVRDKDAVSAMSLMAEIAAWSKERGMSMYQMIQDIYIKYGFSKEKGISVVRKGKQGAEEIQAMMKSFRENPVKTLGGSPVVLIKDFQNLTSVDAEGNVTTLDMPCSSNVLQYFTAAGDKISVRPSGTEPKIKFYIEVRGIKMESYADYAEANRLADEKIEAFKKDLGI